MMTKILSAVLFGMCAGPAFAGDVGVSISLGEPGFYGKIEIGNFPQPQLIYPQPVVIQRAPEFVSAPPIYCTCRLVTRNTGANIARSTTPAVDRSTLCATIGTTGNTCRATSTAAAIIRARAKMRVTAMVKDMTRITAMAKDTTIRTL
jgi:hypothetical protein